MSELATRVPQGRGGRVESAYGNFVEQIHFSLHLLLLLRVQLPSLLREAIVEII